MGALTWAGKASELFGPRFTGGAWLERYISNPSGGSHQMKWGTLAREIAIQQAINRAPTFIQGFLSNAIFGRI